MSEAETVFDDSLLRITDIIGDPKASPPILPLIPISKSSWWAGVRQGRYPRPVKVGPNTTCWRSRDIRAYLQSLETTP